MGMDAIIAAWGLPQELTDEVLGFLHDDPDSLRSCALVAPTWTPTCRHHLFNHLEINLVHVKPAARKVIPATPVRPFKKEVELHLIRLDILLQCLQQTPYMPYYVHHLTLYPGQYVDTGHSIWGEVTKKLNCILNMLVLLRTFDVKLGNWEDYSPDFQATFKNLFARPSLSSVLLQQGRLTETDLASLLPRLSGLSSLTLSSIEIKTSSLNTPTTTTITSTNFPIPSKISGGIPPPIASLQSLHVYGLGVLDCITSWFQASAFKTIPLQSLHIRERVRAWKSIQPLLDLAGSSLQHLALEGPSHYSDMTPSIIPSNLRLDDLTNLQKISLNYVEASEVYSPVPWIISMFAATTKPLALEAFTINLGAMRIAYGFSSDAEMFWHDWAGLDDVLSGKEFHKLQLVEINFYATPSFGSSDLEIEKLRLQFPKLQSRNILNIQPSMYY